ncbi:MAG TPA: response regulator [Ktedonobacterales bacterium]|nr:response regulator [Ktedonobacterales bacterium]
MRAGKGHILVVDDSWTNLALMSRALADAGYTVTTAADGKEAIEKARAERPDCVILDVVLPGQSGFQLCRHLKQSAEGRYVPVILVSVKKTPLDVQWGLQQGADAYLIKPFTPHELLSTVDRVLTSQR